MGMSLIDKGNRHFFAFREIFCLETIVEGLLIIMLVNILIFTGPHAYSERQNRQYGFFHAKAISVDAKYVFQISI